MSQITQEVHKKVLGYDVRFFSNDSFSQWGCTIQGDRYGGFMKPPKLDQAMPKLLKQAKETIQKYG